MTMKDEMKRWTAKRKAALVMEIIQSKSKVAEASRTFDLKPSEIEAWVYEAKCSMENALRAKPMDIREQYEKQTAHCQWFGVHQPQRHHLGQKLRHATGVHHAVHAGEERHGGAGDPHAEGAVRFHRRLYPQSLIRALVTVEPDPVYNQPVAFVRLSFKAVPMGVSISSNFCSSTA